MQQVDEIVVNLIGDAQVTAEGPAGFDMDWRMFGEERARKASGFEEFSGLEADVPIIIVQR